MRHSHCILILHAALPYEVERPTFTVLADTRNLRARGVALPSHRVQWEHTERSKMPGTSLLSGVFCGAALILTLLCLFAGSPRGYMEDFAIITASHTPFYRLHSLNVATA